MSDKVLSVEIPGNDYDELVTKALSIMQSAHISNQNRTLNLKDRGNGKFELFAGINLLIAYDIHTKQYYHKYGNVAPQVLQKIGFTEVPYRSF